MSRGLPYVLFTAGIRGKLLRIIAALYTNDVDFVSVRVKAALKEAYLLAGSIGDPLAPLLYMLVLNGLIERLVGWHLV